MEPIPYYKIAQKETSQRANGNFELNFRTKKGDILVYHAAMTDDHGFALDFSLGKTDIEIKNDSIKKYFSATIPLKLKHKVKGTLQLEHQNYLKVNGLFKLKKSGFKHKLLTGFDARTSQLNLKYFQQGKIKLHHCCLKTYVLQSIEEHLFSAIIKGKAGRIGALYNHGQIIPSVTIKHKLPFKIKSLMEARFLFDNHFIGYEFRSIMKSSHIKSSLFVAPYMSHQELRARIDHKFFKHKVSYGACIIHHCSQWDSNLGMIIKRKKTNFSCLLSQNEIFSATLKHKISKYITVTGGVAYGPLHSRGAIAIFSGKLTLEPKGLKKYKRKQADLSLPICKGDKQCKVK